MRIYSACLVHETNSFSPIPTSLTSFEEGLLWWPRRDSPPPGVEESFVYALTHTAKARGHRVCEGLHAAAQPSGPINQSHFDRLCNDLLEDLDRAGSVDAVLLMLHGAQVAANLDDCEGELLKALRQRVGQDVVIGVELDLHANLSMDMVDAADFVLACREYPHTDFRQRASDLLDLVEQKFSNRIEPVWAVARVPILGLFHTTREPMRSFVDKTALLEKEPGVLAVTLTHGFPWADTAHTGAAVCVYTDGDHSRADDLARNLAAEFFSLREAIAPPLLSMDEALDRVEASSRLPIVIAEAADNPGGGAAGDATYLLQRVLQRGMRDVVIGMLWDPAAVETARRAGVGARLSMRIGGKTGPASGDPLDVEIEVLATCDSGEQIAFGSPSPLGPMAAVRTEGVTVVLGTTRDQVHSPECFTRLGIELPSVRLIIVKSAQHFYEAFRSIAAEVLYVDSPGAVSSDLSYFAFSRLPRPVWPLDDVEMDRC